MLHLSQQGTSSHLPILDRDREQGWLEGKYNGVVWGIGSSRIINFDYPLGATSLLEVPSLCRTVKEFSFWVRKNEITRSIGAETHQDTVFQLFHVCSAMANRFIWTFSDLSPYHVKDILNDAKFGADRVIGASDRIRKALLEIDDWQSFTDEFVSNRQLLRAKFVASCNLPQLVLMLPEASAVMDKFCEDRKLVVKYERSPQNPMRGVKSVYFGYELTLKKLFLLRFLMDATAIQFDPAVATSKVKREKTTTEIMPPRYVFHITRRASEFVINHSASVIERYRLFLGGMKLHLRQKWRLYADVCYLFGSVWFLIAIYTMRRPGEVFGVERDCLHQSPDGQWWIRIPISKNNNRNPWVPVPESVVDGVRALDALCASSGAAAGTELFGYTGIFTGEVGKPDLYKVLKKFLLLSECPKYTDSSGKLAVWKFNPQQTRRFSSVLYFYKEKGSEESLATILGHFSLTTTRAYTKNDPNVAKLWSDTEWGYIGEIVRAVSAGASEFGGAVVQHLKKLAARIKDLFRRKVRIFHPDEVDEATIYILKRQGVSVTPNAWADCFCPVTKTGSKHANCRKGQEVPADAVGPDLSKAAPSTCAGCRWACHSMRQRQHVDGLIIEGERRTATPTTVFDMLERDQIVTLRRCRPSMEPV